MGTETCPVYSDAVRVATVAYARSEEEVRHLVDPYSDIYVGYRDGIPVATMSTTHARSGPLLLEECYPPALFRLGRQRIAAAYRLGVTQRYANDARTARLMMLVGYAQTMSYGAAISLMNANHRMVRYYTRFGWTPIRQARFTHPRYGTPSQVMIYIADRYRHDIFAPIVRATGKHVGWDTVQDHIRVEDREAVLVGEPDSTSNPEAC